MRLDELTNRELAFKLAEVDRDIDKSIILYNEICDEIKRRLPKLKNDPNLKPKVRERRYGE